MALWKVWEAVYDVQTDEPPIVYSGIRHFVQDVEPLVHDRDRVTVHIEGHETDERDPIGFTGEVTDMYYMAAPASADALSFLELTGQVCLIVETDRETYIIGGWGVVPEDVGANHITVESISGTSDSQYLFSPPGCMVTPGGNQCPQAWFRTALDKKYLDIPLHDVEFRGRLRNTTPPPMSAEQPLVLVVEDKSDLTDLYATWLRNDYGVHVAYGGREALDKLDDEADTILFDRQIPSLPGDEALLEIRDRGFECRVAMVTAIESDFDIVVMGFDDYLVKSVSRGALTEIASNLILRNAYDVGTQDLSSLMLKKVLLESEKGEVTLEENEKYQWLTARLTELRRELDETLGQLDDTEGASAICRDIGDEADVDNS